MVDKQSNKLRLDRMYDTYKTTYVRSINHDLETNFLQTQQSDHCQHSIKPFICHQMSKNCQEVSLKPSIWFDSLWFDLIWLKVTNLMKLQFGESKETVWFDQQCVEFSTKCKSLQTGSFVFSECWNESKLIGIRMSSSKLFNATLMFDSIKKETVLSADQFDGCSLSSQSPNNQVENSFWTTMMTRFLWVSECAVGIK